MDYSIIQAMTELSHIGGAVERIDPTLTHCIAVLKNGIRPSEEKTAEYYLGKSYAKNTYKGYLTALTDFSAWTGGMCQMPIPSATIARYIADRAKVLGPNTLAHRVAALAFIHSAFGYPDPTRLGDIRRLLRGIRRDKIEEGWEERRAPAFSLAQFKAMLDLMGGSLHDLRDRALLLTGLFGAFRQSELTGLTLSSLTWLPQRGVVVSMGPVKQDQVASKRHFKALPLVRGSPGLCPVTALRNYLDATGIEEGPVFRGISRHLTIGDAPLSKNTANRIVQKWAARANLPYAKKDNEKGDTDASYSMHSFRASFVTVLREAGLSDALIARQTDHRNLATMQVYDRPESAFNENPALILADALGEAHSSMHTREY